MKNWSYDALRNEIFSNGQHGEKKKRDEHDDESVWIYSYTHTHTYCESNYHLFFLRK